MTQELNRSNQEIQILIKHIEEQKGAVPVDSIPTEEGQRTQLQWNGSVLPGAQEIGPTTMGYEEEKVDAPLKSQVERTEELLSTNKNLTGKVELTPEELKNQAQAFDKFR